MKEKIEVIVSLLLSILMIMTVYIPNVFGLALCSLFSIVIFALRRKMISGNVLAYIISFCLLFIRCSATYEFKNAIVLSWSFVIVFQVIALISVAITTSYDLIYLEKYGD